MVGVLGPNLHSAGRKEPRERETTMGWANYTEQEKYTAGSTFSRNWRGQEGMNYENEKGTHQLTAKRIQCGGIELGHESSHDEKGGQERGREGRMTEKQHKPIKENGLRGKIFAGGMSRSRKNSPSRVCSSESNRAEGK